MFSIRPLSIFFLSYFLHLTLTYVIASKGSLFGKNDACKEMVLLPKYTFSTSTTHSDVDCAFRCSNHDSCISFHFEEASETCSLNNYVSSSDCYRMIENKDVQHFDKLIPKCFNGGSFVGEVCKCVGGYVGERCERLMTDCSEGLNSNNDYKSDIYNIQPPFTDTSFQVRCIMIYRGRTLVQYRAKADEDFNRNWTDYRNGFGSLNKDFWLGLENMYQIVRNRTFDLQVYVKMQNGTYFQHRFMNFTLGDEASKYVMHISGARPHRTNPLGDSLSNLNGSKFSTPDSDNDNWSDGDCAGMYESGFWFNRCGPCNPNGQLLKPDNGKQLSHREIFWKYDLGDDVPFKMQIWLEAA